MSHKSYINQPAFPTAENNYEKDYSDSGMTLRDYFAAKAMQALIGGGTNAINADMAYLQADAMMERRQK